MSSEPDVLRPRPRGRPRSSEVVGGYLSATAIFVSVVGIAWHPLRVIPPAILIALVGAGMAPRDSRLARAAVMIAASCFFLGMTVAVITSRPLW